MIIEPVRIRRFRGLEDITLDRCSGLNVLIGRNNSGKSSVLAAIELAMSHLRTGKIASNWQVKYDPKNEFTNKVTTKPIQIGLTFALTVQVNEAIRQKLTQETTGLEVAIEQLRGRSKISVIIAAEAVESDVVIYVQEIALGEIESDQDGLRTQSDRLLSVPSPVAIELAARESTISRWQRALSSLDSIEGRVLDYTVGRDSPNRVRRLRDIMPSFDVTPEINARFETIMKESESVEQARSEIDRLKSSIDDDIEALIYSEIKTAVSLFSGSAKALPKYVPWLIETLGVTKVISFKETRPAVGREEAAQILRLKTKRGGSEALDRIQKTVRALLGVNVDAFEPEIDNTRRRAQPTPIEAEMDIDDFLVEANGAGIREALRIILDLELKNPTLALIEEPEVHLHRGLERVLFSYLVNKSQTVQLFIATHSANFLDASSRQNVYLVSRPKKGSASIDKVASEGDLLRISEEVGLRPSTVLMFDQLIFVEGPSDEAIILEIAKKLDLDLTTNRTTVVQMGGASRFAHFAAEATLNLLSRRQIKMWFLLDRDERDDADVKRLETRLGAKAKIHVLNRRELENYLLFPEIVRDLIGDKNSTSGQKIELPSVPEVTDALKTAANSLLDRTVGLRSTKRLLKPLYPNFGGENIQERLEKMKEEVERRIQESTATQDAIRQEIAPSWAEKALYVAAGSEILEEVLSKYGFKYRKELDGQRLAEKINANDIDTELRRLLGEVCT